METLKNILLGLLIGIVICMGFEIHSLRQQAPMVEVIEHKEDPLIMFERFFDMVLEFEERRKEQESIVEPKVQQ